MEHGMVTQTSFWAFLFNLHAFTVRVLVGTNAIYPHRIVVKQRLHWLRFVNKAAMVRIRSEIEITMFVALLNARYHAVQVN